MAATTHVNYTGREEQGGEGIFALVVRDLGADLLELIYFPEDSPLEHVQASRGTGVGTWQPA